MLIRGEPDLATASIEDWIAHREHLRSLPFPDDSVHVALAVANAQIQRLKTARVTSAENAAIAG